MAELILHHHDPSPFAEKIRLVFGLKGLSWASVQVPMIMPKPDLTLLTGGYRKAPVLQIGADVYCDTSLIARELEQRFPEPTLFPAGHVGLGYALSRWSDKAFFEPGAGLSMGENEGIPQEILDDRFKFFNFMDFGDMPAQMPHCYAQFQAQAQLLEDELAAIDTPYLTGEAPSWIDIQAYFSVWMANTNIPRAEELLEPFPHINAWSGRMEQIGRGERSDIDASRAHAAAHDAEPQEGIGVAANPFHDFVAGDAVNVMPDDYGFDPVEGRLTGLDTRRIVIERYTDELGSVAVHFPRAGYRIAAA
ncbi:MAG: glutathione S-transferase family protein [Woeseiaceae bacterium]|nr:glutathione S-transferase family protein [Woeseiaceae bacterium]